MDETGDLEAVKEIIKKRNRFAISSHVRPDGDAIGSQLALANLLGRLNKETIIVDSDPPPNNLLFLPQIDWILEPKEAKGKVEHIEVWFFLDASSKDRVGKEVLHLAQGKTIINIDHHIDNPRFGDINYVQDIASTSMIIYNLAKELKVDIDKRTATHIYTGIASDTDTFRNSNTSKQAMAISAVLLGKGVSAREVAINLYEIRTRKQLKLLAYILNEAQFSDGIIWSALPLEILDKTGSSLQDTELLIENLRAVEGIEVAVLFKELAKGKVKVSLRSKDVEDVNDIAKKFGGGGHKKAAGFVMEEELTEVIERVIDEIKVVLGEKEAK